MRRATSCRQLIHHLSKFLSTLSLRRATSVRPETRRHDVISIHALLAESDSQQPRGTTRTTYFYPRSPCGERQHESADDMFQNQFLSTLSLRRATVFGSTWLASRSYFYPRSPCGERRTMTTTICTVSRFLSTLSLRRATKKNLEIGKNLIFLSTLSLRRATYIRSIRQGTASNFYPRSPCGERPL